MWLTVLASVAQAGVLRHALVVGANEGGGTLDPLRYAELDAQRMAEVLVDLGGFEAPYVTVLYAPTAAELRDALRAHATMAAGFDDDLFLFYYSGHADARGLRLSADAYAFDTLRADIRGMPSDVKLGVLDACRSGTITRLKGAALSEPFLVDDRLAAEGEAWMTATSADESAQESDRLRGSFFTHYLLSGLRGAADTGDGLVSLDEAYRYAFDRVVDHTGGTAAGPQHPNFDFRLKGQGDLPLTRVAEGRATVTLPEELAGDVSVVRMPDRTPVAEVAKKAGAAVTLALPPGTYKFRLVNGRDVKESMIGVSDGSRVVATRWGAVNAELGGAKGAVALDALELARARSREGLGWASAALGAEGLRHSALVAGGASVLIPGGGQFYNGEWGKGTAMFAGTFALLGGSLLSDDEGFFRGSITGPDPLRLGAAMLYGASIADAAWNVQRREAGHPQGGWTLSTSSVWGPHGVESPWAAGVSVEWLARPGLAVALDRTGWTRAPDGSSAWNAGGRLQVAFAEGPRMRPGAFAAVGLRVRDTAEDAPSIEPVVGLGSNLRWYVTPRYFVDGEVRIETDGGAPVMVGGGGLGVHFGK